MVLRPVGVGLLGAGGHGDAQQDQRGERKGQPTQSSDAAHQHRGDTHGPSIAIEPAVVNGAGGATNPLPDCAGG